MSTLNSNKASGAESSLFGGIARYKKRILTLVIIIALFYSIQLVFMFFNIQIVRGYDQKLIEKLGVDRSYDAGFVNDCTSQGPVGFGEVTGYNICEFTMARIYYPKIVTVTPSHQTLITGETIYADGDIIVYVDADNRSIEQYIELGTPVGKKHVPKINSLLRIKPMDEVNWSALGGSESSVEGQGLGGKWWWSVAGQGLGDHSPASRLRDDISKKILANESPAKGAPTASDALAEQRAPLVVFYTSRYCHSPDVIGLDRMCILPD